MARKKASCSRRATVQKMKVCRVTHTKKEGFNTHGFTFDTSQTLLRGKMFTFSSKVARELGYVDGTMKLCLVWGDERVSVQFRRDAHKGGGWRSKRKDFKHFYALVGFREHQGYDVYQVKGSGDPAFRFVKSWEWFPTGGSVNVADFHAPPEEEIPEDDESQKGDPSSSSKKTSNVDGFGDSRAEGVKWRRSVGARKTTPMAASPMLKRRIHRKQQKTRFYAGQGAVLEESGTSTRDQGMQKRRKLRIIGYQQVKEMGPPGFPVKVKMELVWGSTSCFTLSIFLSVLLLKDI